MLRDITSENIQENLIIQEHKNNKTQLLNKFYFPKMFSKIERIVKLCSVFREQKYDRHPPKPETKPTPIPSYPGEIVRIDIFQLRKN